MIPCEATYALRETCFLSKNDSGGMNPSPPVMNGGTYKRAFLWVNARRGSLLRFHAAGHPVPAALPIQHERTQRVTLGHVGMIEVVGGRMDHLQPLHDPAGPQVGGRGKGDDFLQSQGVEPEIQRRGC